MPHTLAPWTIYQGFNVMGGPDGRRSVANAGGHADNRLPDNGLGENRANALLIAAAPELLEAVRLLLTHHSETANDIKKHDILFARNAYDKAVGA